MAEKVKKYMTEQEAADYLKMSPKTLQKWRHQGNSPAYSKLGRCIRYLESDLDEYASSRKIGPVR